MQSDPPKQEDTSSGNIGFDDSLGFLETTFKDFFDGWLSERHQQFTEQMQVFRQQMSDTLAGSAPEARSENGVDQLWARLESLFQDMVQRVNLTAQVDDDGGGLLVHWHKQYYKDIQALKPLVRVPFTMEIWAPSPDDSRWLLFQKKLGRIQSRLSDSINWLTSRGGNGRVHLQHRSRPVPLRDLASYVGTLAFSPFLLQEWEQYQQFIRAAIDTIRGIWKEIALALLFSDEGDPLWSATDATTPHPLIDQCLGKLEKIDEMNRALASRLSVSKTRFQEWFGDFTETWNRNASQAGTRLLPSRRYSRYQYNRHNQKKRKIFLQNRKQWLDHMIIEETDWKEELLLFRLIFMVVGRLMVTVEHVRGDIDAGLVPAFRLAEEAIRKAGGQIKNSLDEPEGRTADRLKNESQILDRNLKKKVLPSLIERLINSRSVPVLSEFVGSIQETVDQFPEQMRVFKVRDLTSVPPASEQYEVPLRELFKTLILLEFRTGMDQVMNQLKENIENVLISVSEIDQIAGYATAPMLDQPEEGDVDTELIQTSVEGLERAADKAVTLSGELKKAGGQAISEFNEQIRGFILEVQQLINNEKLIELHFQLIQSKLKHRLRSAGKLIRQSLKNGFTRTRSAAGRLKADVENRMRQIGYAAGFLTPHEDLEERFQKQLTKTWQSIETLPFIYLDLFRLVPLIDEQFFTLRDQEMAKLKDHFSLWLEGQYSISAVVGERGVGKTTLVNMAEKTIFEGYKTTWISPPERCISTENCLNLFRGEFEDFKGNSFEDLEQYLLGLKHRRVCVIKKIHFFFLKTIDGFDLIEQLLLLINRTFRKIFWIVTCNQHSWPYLNKVVGIENYFPGIIGFSNLTTEETEAFILKRHKVTGYKLHFEPDREIQTTRRYKNAGTEEAKQIIIKERFFEQLQESAEGNMALAILFWLISIKRIDQAKMIMRSRINLEYEILNQLSQEELFSLGALVQHEIMSENDHAAVFHQEEIRSRQHLKIMSNKGILVEDKPGRFNINLAVYRPLVQILKRHRILF